jgi:hypothetical protein
LKKYNKLAFSKISPKTITNYFLIDFYLAFLGLSQISKIKKIISPIPVINAPTINAA